MISVMISHRTRNTYRPSDGLNPCWAWCVENFGYPNLGRWSWDNYRKFSFKNEEDAVLFSLRWT